MNLDIFLSRSNNVTVRVWLKLHVHIHAVSFYSVWSTPSIISIWCLSTPVISRIRIVLVARKQPFMCWQYTPNTMYLFIDNNHPKGTVVCVVYGNASAIWLGKCRLKSTSLKWYRRLRDCLIFKYRHCLIQSWVFALRLFSSRCKNWYWPVLWKLFSASFCSYLSLTNRVEFTIIKELL